MKILLLIVLLFFNSNAFANEIARPKSLGEEYLLELNFGAVQESDHEAFEIGFEVERFIESFNHHLAIGLSLEASDINGELKYFTGGLLSLYYHHFKLFISSGLFFNNHKYKEWKTRLGFGREFVLEGEYVLVPSFTLDSLEGECLLGFTVGLAKEF